MPLSRPAFQTMWSHFSTIHGDGSLKIVGATIGGKVQENIDLGIKDPSAGFTNACAIRMSYCLNRSGTPITRGIWKAVSGGDKMQYIYRVSDLIKFMHQAFGKADLSAKNPQPKDFQGLRGILLFGVPWRDATGHATLWNGATCSDHCHFPIATEASIWLLK
ncbi:hypothetical protein C0V76_17975 [Uliginosibacterium sp. TH139]|nr:hypothetical protein C0V76_17975 [Uliginosibacterium sp. TH139]